MTELDYSSILRAGREARDRIDSWPTWLKEESAIRHATLDERREFWRMIRPRSSVLGALPNVDRSKGGED